MFNEKPYKRPKPFVLIVLDGLGVAPPGPGNAVTLAKTKNLDQYWFKYPHCYLHASGSAVGLPSGTNGNSEVGHMNIGAGKVVFQELPRIDNAIANDTFYSNQKLVDAVTYIKKTKGKLHLMGLVSQGKVHSSLDHLYALLRLCKEQGLHGRDVAIHAFTDGRDTPPKSAVMYLDELEAECKRQGVGQIVSIIGRYYAMDRDERWERTKKAYDLLVSAVGKPFNHWKKAVEDAYSVNETDEYIEPLVITDNGQAPIATVSAGDAIIFFNFRPDRAIELTKAFMLDTFNGWNRGPKLKDIMFVGFNEYEDGLPEFAAFPPEDILLPIGRLISDAGLRQLRISESEKFPHVTYFINGGNEIVYPAEDRIEIPSPRDVPTYDLKPEMSAFEVTAKLEERIRGQIYDLIMVNYANADMVAHTGILAATVRSIEVIDECLGKVIDATLSQGGAAIITADHGNAEELINLQTGQVDTEHSTNPVPFIFLSAEANSRELSFGILADISPTILAVMGIQKPSSMTGRNLLL